MADFSDYHPLTQPCLREIEAIAARYLQEGLDPASVLCALATVAIKTAQTDPQYKQMYLDYFADVVRGAGDVTVV